MPLQRFPMPSRRLLLFGIGGALLAIAIALFTLRPPAAADMATAVVTVGDLEQTVLATGRLQPKELVNVGAQVSGQVRRLYVALGQSVRAGQRIADIDAEQQQLALRTAEAAVRSLQGQITAREGALAQAEAAFARQETMLAADATSRADFEAASAVVTGGRGEMQSLRAQLTQARIQVDIARSSLGYTRIVAPIDGVVVAVVTKQGQTVNSLQSAPTIVMLAKLDVMTVRAEISEADVQNVRVGQPVSFTTLGASEERRNAQIEYIEPAPASIGADATAQGASTGANTPSAIYYNALFDVANGDRRLRPSMTVRVSVVLARAQRAILVPAAALGARDAQGRRIVRVLDDRGRIEERHVRVGIGDDTTVVVRSGLRPGERVVIAQAAPGNAAADVGMMF